MNAKAAVFVGMGFELVAAVLLFMWLGHKLDENCGWGGIGAALGTIVGMIGWITHLLIVVRNLAKETKAEQIDRP